MEKCIGKLAAFVFLGPLSTCLVQAATSESSLNIDAIVGTACSVSVTPIDFGVVAADINTWTAGSITFICTPGITFGIALDAGQNFDGLQRLMSDGLGNFVSYDIISPVFGPWGDDGLTYPAPILQDLTSTGSDELVVEAYLPAHPLTTPAGYYSDMVKVTVFY